MPAPASRMHEIDLALLDEALEPCCIGEHGKGILARHGKGHDFATGLGDGGEIVGKAVGDAGAVAGAAEKFRDVGPAGGELAAKRGLIECQRPVASRRDADLRQHGVAVRGAGRRFGDESTERVDDAAHGTVER